MKHRLVALVTAVNLILLMLVWSRSGSGAAQPTVAPVLRASTVELVDAHGRVRTRLSVEDGGDVVLRLFGEDGTIRVKLGASEAGSGLLLLDEATEPAIHMIARRAATSERPNTTGIVVRGAEGEPRVIRP
jgi:hypothetical protein